MSNNAIVSPTPPARRHFLNTRRMSEGARTLVPIMEQLESSHLENCSGSHEEINCESSEWSMIRETLITVPIHSCTNTTTTTTTTTAENADTVIAGLGIAGDRRSMAASLVMSIMSAHDDAADYQSCIDEEEKEEMEKAEEEGEDGGAPCATVFKRISVIEPPWFQNHPDAQSVLNTSTSVIQRIRALPDHNLPHNNNSNKLTASYSSLSASTAALATPSLSMKSVEETLETQQNHHRSLSHDTIASFYEDAVTDHGNIEHLAEEGEDEEVEEDCSSDKQRPPSLSAVIAQQPPLTFFTSLATSSPPLTRAKAYATLGDEIIELPPRRQAIQDNSNDALPAILSLSSSAAINTTSNDEIQVLNSQQQQQQQIPSALPSSTSKFGSLERMKKILTSKSRKEEDEATLSGSPHPPPVYTLTRDIILKGKNSIKKGIALISTSSTRLRQQEGPDDNPGGVRVSEDEANVVPWNRVSTLFRRQKSVESKQEVEDQTSTGQASDSGVLNIHRQISLDAINKANSSISKRNSSNSKYHIGVSIDDLEFKLVCDKKRHRASRRLSKVPGIGSPPVLSDSSYQEPPSFKRNHLHNHRDSVISVALTSCSTVDDDKEVLMGRGDEEKSLRRRSNLFRSHTLSQMSGTEVMKHYITIKYVFVGGRSENISAVLVRVSRNISLNGFKTKIIDKLLRMQQQQQQQLEEVQSRQHQQHYDQSYFLGRMNRMEYIDEDGHSVTLLDEEDFAISINECSKKLILYEAQIG